MKLIQELGVRRLSDGKTYSYGLYLCESCNSEVEKRIYKSRESKWCSRKCYDINRGRRGAYKGKIMINKYRYIYSPDHPKAIRGFYVAEHRLKIEEKIGRYLLDTEIVHHIDEDTLNNSLDNLQILTTSEHATLHCNFNKHDK